MIVQLAIATRTTPDYWAGAEDRIVATAIAELEAQAEEARRSGR